MTQQKDVAQQFCAVIDECVKIIEPFFCNRDGISTSVHILTVISVFSPIFFSITAFFVVNFTQDSGYILLNLLSIVPLYFLLYYRGRLNKVNDFVLLAMDLKSLKLPIMRLAWKGKLDGERLIEIQDTLQDIRQKIKLYFQNDV